MKEHTVLPRWWLHPYMVVTGTVVGVGLLLAAMATEVAGAPSKQDVVEGQRTFQQICAACHTIGAGARVGPDLQGVTERRDAAWLRVHIVSPSVHQAQNDPISLANREKYGLFMPDLGVTERQADSVIAFLGGGASAPAEMPTLYLPTLAAAVLAIALLTFVALRAGTKRIEVRA